MKHRGQEAAHLGQTLWNEPRSFPREALRTTKRSFRTVWNARGGGLYACGFVIAFAWLEVKTLYNEIASADGIGSFVSDWLLEFLIRFSIQSIENTVHAFLWPIYLVQRFEGWGIAILTILYLTFPRFIKPALTRWLFDDEDEPRADPASTDETLRSDETDKSESA